MTMRPGLGGLVREELQRLSASAELGLSGTPPEERFDKITRLARSVFRVPVARIVVVDEEYFFIKSPQLPGDDLVYSRAGSLCDLAIDETEILVVPDVAADPRLSSLAHVRSLSWLRFYAGRPLLAPSGHRVGVLCLMDEKPRFFDAEERALLDEMGELVEQELRGLPAPA